MTSTEKTLSLSQVTALFGALSDATRLRIVRLMAVNKAEVCVCELVDCLEEAQYHVSRHLKELRDCGLVQVQREGRWMYYSLNQRDPTARLLAETVVALPAPLFAVEQQNFEKRMKLRVAGRCCIGIQKTHLASEGNHETKHVLRSKNGLPGRRATHPQPA